MNILKKYFLILILTAFAAINSGAQSVTGVPGYVRIPTAQFNEDGSLLFGVSYLPKDFLAFSKNNYNAMAYYTSLTFLPFLEIDFRLTSMIDHPDYTVDRMPSIRVRLIEEKKWYPSVAIGVHDFGAAINFGASYLVCTKSFYFKKIDLNLEGTIGYGTDWLNSKDHEFAGLFGGISINWEKIKWTNVMFDYDGRTVNTGIRFIFFKHLRLLIGLQGGDAITGSVSYQVNLK